MRQDDAGQYFARGEEEPVIDVRGYDLVARIGLTAPAYVPIGADTLAFVPRAPGDVRVTWRGREIAALPLDSVVGTLDRVPNMRARLPANAITIIRETDELRLQVRINHLSGMHAREGRPLEVTGAQATVLIDIR